MKRILTTTLLTAAIGLLSACSTSGGMTALKVPTKDPQAAIRKLSMFGIESHFDEEEGMVFVNRDREVRAARILTTANMLPNGNIAYGFLKDSDLAQTAAEAAMIHRVELQQVLSDTISSMISVDTAVVNLTPASRPYYYRFEKKDLAAKASVMVTTIDNRPLNEAEVMSIAQLIAGSTETLEAKNVFIQDTKGRHYPVNEDWRQSHSIMQARANANAEAEHKVRTILSAYKPMVSAHIVMTTGDEPSTRGKGEKPTALYKEIRVHSSQNKKRIGTSGSEMEAGRNSDNDPGRGEVDPAKSTESEDFALKPDYSKSTIAVTISDEFELSEEKLLEMKETISKATNIPVENVELMQTAPWKE